MNYRNLLLLTLTGLALSACTNDSPNDLIDTRPIDGEVTYALTVKSIINNNCISCHGTIPSNNAPMSLATYDNVKDAILNLGLIDRISKENGDGLLMPQGGPKLPQNKIDEIIKWQTDGFQQ